MTIIKNYNKIIKNDYFDKDFIIFKNVFGKKIIKKLKKIYFKYSLKYDTKFSNNNNPSDNVTIVSFLFNYYEDIKKIENNKNKKFIKNFYSKLESILNIANERYKFKITGINPKIVINQMIKGTNIKFHKDLSSGNFSIIKLVGIMSLTEEKKYQGGEFNILNSPYNNGKFEDINSYTFKYKLDIGDIIIFPSYVMHGVNEVTEGIRNTMVFSLEGDAFR